MKKGAYEEIGMTISYPCVLVVFLCFLLFNNTRAGKDIAPDSCEKYTTSSADKERKELLSAVKRNRPQMVMVLTSKGVNIDMKTDSGDSLLHVAVICGSNDVARTLLKLGVDPNHKGSSGVTPMYRATEINNVPIMKELYEKGADIRVKYGFLNESLLHLACLKGHLEAGALLLDAGINPNIINNKSVTPLHLCAQKNHLKLAKLLLARGANINSRDRAGNAPLHFAVRSGQIEIVRYLIEAGAKVKLTSNTGATPLHNAAEGGNTMLADLLINKGAPVNAVINVMGVSPLHLAVYNLNFLKLLIKRGADVNFKTYHGDSPLHWAASGSSRTQASVVQELIKSGADVNSRSKNGWTPLHVASFHGLRGILKVLLENGACVSCVDNSGRTPLHYAAASGDIEVINMLLSRGASTEIQDGEGETPYSWARNMGNIEVAQLLKRPN